MKPNFKAQVELLLDVIKYATFPGKLALKGGTAINLFMNDLPRLSVDIDLAYLPINTREIASKDIAASASAIISNIKLHQPRIFCSLKTTADGFPSKIQVVRDHVEIKIEINNVFRGAVYQPVKLKLCNKAQDLFGRYVQVESLSFEDVYAGKFCAALDRAHPRDLFDLIIFFKNHEFSETLKNAFLVYLLGAGRPIVELLDPNYLNQEDLYKREFVGMTDVEPSYLELEEARDRLIKLIRSSLTDKDKEFLIAFESGAPNWNLFELQDIENLPSIKWRLMNLQKLNLDKKDFLAKKLEKVLS